MKVGRRGFLGVLVAAVGLARLLPNARLNPRAFSVEEVREMGRIWLAPCERETARFFDPLPDPGCVGARKSAVGAV